jgi:hypothetical protein
MTNEPENKMGIGPQYSKRWPGAIPAFTAEEEACAHLAFAKARHQAEPSPANEALVQAAQMRLDRARKTYRTACEKDEKRHRHG